MSLSPVLVRIQREVRVGDGAGGKTKSWRQVGTGMATQNYYSKTSLMRLEQGAHNAQGPGSAGSATKNLFVFEVKPFPRIRVQDRLVDPAGVRWVVQFAPRVYDDSLQVDTELVA